MGAIASQITSLAIVYLTVYSDADQRKQMVSNAENVSIWWRHHGMCGICLELDGDLRSSLIGHVI